MTENQIRSAHTARKAILVVSLSLHLTGHPINAVIESDWKKTKADNAREHFDNVGFDINIEDVPSTIENLRNELKKRSFDGVLVGWCTRGHVEFTVLFEDIVGVCSEEMRSRPEMKLLFNTGPGDLVEPVLRNFPISSIS